MSRTGFAVAIAALCGALLTSGSMAEPNKWAKVEVIYQTLFTAMLGYSPGARIFAYNERGDTCRITEIYRQGKFYSVMPHGRTASGEAIIATALSLKNHKRKPYIIHVTDGASNWGCGVHDAIQFCRKKRISLLTVGLECDPMNMTALREEYGELLPKVREAIRDLLLPQLKVHRNHAGLDQAPQLAN